jgi:hypothetical protein
MPTNNRIVGTTLVVIGLLILLGQMGVDFFGWLWPVLLCGIGGVLLWSWYTREDDSGKVFSGVLLVLLAFFFLFMRREHVDMIRHWPFFVLAPGISLLVMSRVDRSRRDASVPGWIAVAAALVLYFFTSGLFMGLMGFVFGLIGLVLRLLVPLALVGLGGWMLLNHRRREQAARPQMPEKYEPQPPTEPDQDPVREPAAWTPVPKPVDVEETEDEFESDPTDGEPDRESVVDDDEPRSQGEETDEPYDDTDGDDDEEDDDDPDRAERLDGPPRY